MTKTFSPLLALLAVIAAAIPATAAAAPAITDPPNTLLARGAKVQATNLGAISIQTSLGKIVCTTFDHTAEITSNTGTTVKGVGIGQGSVSGCTLGTKKPTGTDLTLPELHTAVVGSGTTASTVAIDIPFPTPETPDNTLVCHFTSPNMPFTYTSGTDVIKFTNGDFVATPAACEPGLFNAEFTVETDGGGSVILD